MHPATLLRTTLGRSTTILACALAVAAVAGCGSDSDSGSSNSGGSSGGNTQQLTASTDGAEIFKQSTCASCHTLAAAGAKGQIGPNLDEEKPAADLVVDRVTNGDGSMPSFKGRLSTEQIQAVADYVAKVAGQ